MLKSLNELTVRVKYGPHFKTYPSGTARYLKGQHIGEAGEIREGEDSYARLTEAELAAHRLRPDQVIVVGKGHRNVAWAYRPAVGPVVASSSFYVLTLRPEAVLPAYCALVLNSASCGRALKRMAKGTSVPVVPKNELLNLRLPVPPLARQAELVALNDLQRRRRLLHRELAACQQQLDRAVLSTLLYA